MHCNREEVVSIAIPDRRFSDTLAVYLLPRLVLTRTLRLWENRLAGGEFLTWGQFQWHYRAQLASQLLGY